jgi:hypothetical protein
MTHNRVIKTTIYADDQIIKTKCEEELQIATRQLNKIARECTELPT